LNEATQTLATNKKVKKDPSVGIVWYIALGLEAATRAQWLTVC